METKEPEPGDRIIILEGFRDIMGGDILERNREAHKETIRNIQNYKRTGIIKHVAPSKTYGYRCEAIMDEQGKDLITKDSEDFNRISGRLEVYSGDFTYQEIKP